MKQHVYERSQATVATNYYIIFYENLGHSFCFRQIAWYFQIAVEKGASYKIGWLCVCQHNYINIVMFEQLERKLVIKKNQTKINVSCYE